jgi:hypothetical protein
MSFQYECLFCHKILYSDYASHVGKFCCKSHAAQYNNSLRSTASRNKQKETLNKTLQVKFPHITEPVVTENRICLHCKQEFCVDIKSTRKYCSRFCSGTHLGGIRRSGRVGSGKKGYYKGYQLDSTYELAYVIYCLDHNIVIERNTRYWEYQYDGKIRKYYPDFIVNNKLVEIKNYKSAITDAKIKSVNEPIEVLYTDDLKSIFSYVSSTYNLKIEKLYQLYDS